MANKTKRTFRNDHDIEFWRSAAISAMQGIQESGWKFIGTFADIEDGMICGVEGGTIRFNQPTFGSWDPLTDNVGFDVHRFFRILKILANESQEVIPQFEKMWVAYLNERSEFNDKQEYIAEAYRANARTIAYQLLE